MRQHNFKIIFCGHLLACLHFLQAADANTVQSKTHDCAEIELEAVIDPEATREDNLARLSQQFFQSVNTIEHCDQERDNDGAASSPDSNSAANADETDGPNATSGNSGGANSFASSDVTGATSEQMSDSTDSKNSTNTDADNTAMTTPKASGSLIGTNFDQIQTEPASAFAAPSASNMAGATPQSTQMQNSTTQEQTDTGEQDLRLTNGKTPDDIPDANNDSVFEAQVRAAAMAETDPDTKKNLWNEYRRYKGLPEQE